MAEHRQAAQQDACARGVVLLDRPRQRRPDVVGMVQDRAPGELPQPFLGGWHAVKVVGVQQRLQLGQLDGEHPFYHHLH